MRFLKKFTQLELHSPALEGVNLFCNYRPVNKYLLKELDSIMGLGSKQNLWAFNLKQLFIMAHSSQAFCGS